MERPSLYLSEEDNGIVRCSLCPRRCVIPSGHFGACGVRGNKNGKGLLPFYGHVTSVALDPIEKKPLFHFRPGSMILSVGFSGCNLRCPFCQNWHISQSAAAPGKEMLPADIVSAALHTDVLSIAYTYSEPLIHAEFLLDCMALAHRHGIVNVLVTNGCANAADGGAAAEILSLTDAANIDLKCFSSDTYKKTLGGNSDESLSAVLGFIRLACAQGVQRTPGVHVEITTLVIPELNDSAGELDACADFIASLGGGIEAIPWHLSAYHPDYRWNAPHTDPGLLIQTRKRAQKKLNWVYTGNIPGENNNTVCPHCGTILVRRRGYRIETPGLTAPKDGENFFRCIQCGEKTPVNC